MDRPELMAQITYKQMAKLFHRLATSYAAGVDIRSVYEREVNAGGTAYRINARRVLDQLNQGRTLARAMAQSDGYFPELPIAVVQAGERGGRLEESFRKLSDHYTSIVKFRTNFLMSIAWPVFELFFSIFVIGMLILIMGWVCETANIAPIDWLGLGLSTTQYFLLYWSVVFLLFGTLFMLGLGVLYGWFGTLPMQIARRIPLVGKTIESLALSRFAWTMSVAENAGMNPVETAQLAVRSTQNYYYERLEEPLCEDLQRGQSFVRAMRSTDSFPDDFLLMVDTGEIAGELAETMDRASQEHQNRAENNMKMIGTIGFIGMLLFVGLIVGCLIIFMYKKLILDQYSNFLNCLISDLLEQWP
ncbi:MAG: type II secretion system F family protein [Mariniblastus sp.]|nr:type II secretion system F family protein [Mariniblastus sp.]